MPAGVNIPLLLAFGLSGGAALLAALQLWAKRRPSDAGSPNRLAVGRFPGDR